MSAVDYRQQLQTSWAPKQDTEPGKMTRFCGSKGILKKKKRLFKPVD